MRTYEGRGEDQGPGVLCLEGLTATVLPDVCLFQKKPGCRSPGFEKLTAKSVTL